MSNVLDFIMRLTDQLSPAMRQAASVADSAAARIQNDMNKATGSTNTFGSSLNQLKSRLDAVNQTRMNTNISDVFSKATKEANKLEQQISRLENKGKSSGGGLGIGSLVAGFGLFQAGKSTIGAAAEREQQRTSFGVLTGSQKAGDKLLGDLVKMGDTTPFEGNDLIKNAEMLKAFGIENERVLPTLRMLGDVSMGNKEKLHGLSLAYAQVQSTGRLMGQDLLQMINQGFNPLQEISKATGKTMAQLKKEMEDGKISADMVTAAFQRATGPGGMFNQMMEKQSQTVSGRWSTMMDAMHKRLLALGQILEPVTKFVIDLGSAIFSSTPLLLTIAGVIGTLTLSVYGATWATNAWSFAQGILNTVMKANPVILIIGLILILAGWIYTLVKRFEGWGTSMRATWEIIKSFIHLNMTIWKAFGETIWYYVQYGWLKFMSFIEWIQGAIGNVARAMGFLFTLEFGKAKDALFAEIITPSSKKIDELQKKHAANQAEYKSIVAADVQSMADSYKKIGLTKKPGTNAIEQNVSVIGGKSSTATLTNNLTEKANNINSGGQRSIVINIGKQIETFEVHTMTVKEGIDELGQLVREELRRVLYSLNGMANG